MKDLEKLRKLGPTEQLLLSRSSLGLYHNVGVTASYHCSSSDLVISDLKKLVHSALAKVIALQPHLSIVPIHEEATEPYFCRLPSVQLTDVCSFCETNSSELSSKDAEVESLLQDEHNKPFHHGKSRRPPWRFVVLFHRSDPTKFSASLILDHVILDTRSGVMFHQQFAEALSNASLHPSKSTSSCKRDILPALEDLCEPQVLQAPLTSDKLENHAQISLRPGSIPWSGNVQSIPLTSRLAIQYIDVETTGAFASSCKVQNTSVTATLQTLFARTLLSLVPSKYNCIRMSNAVSLRPWLRGAVDPKYMGVFVSTYEEDFNREQLCTDSFPWEQARECKSQISSFQTNNGIGASSSNYSTISDFDKYHLSKIGKKRPTAIDFSNVGVATAQPPNEAWRLGTLIFSQSASVCRAALRPNVATGHDGRLSIAYAWQKGVIADHLVAGIIEAVREGIQELARGNDGDFR